MKLNVLTGLPVNTLADLSSGLSKKNQRGRDYSARHVAVRSVALILIAYYAIAMSAQSVTIEVAPQVATILEKLKARAEAQGVTLDALLRKLLPISEISDEQVEMTIDRAAIFGEPKRLSHEEKLAALQRLEGRQATRPFTEAGDIVATLREARSGAMWGYEPTE